MEKEIENIRQTRLNFVELIEGLSIEAVNKVLKHFNNNILWNFGHVVASQQILCYKLAGLPFQLPSDFIEKYRKGTKPEQYINESEVEVIKKYAESSLQQLATDLEAGLFNSFNAYKTSYGVQLNTIADAVTFLQLHDSLHLGYAMALNRLVKD